MRLFEALLPQRTNSGGSYATSISDWLHEALRLAGGFTIVTDDARGAWSNGDRTMLDNSSLIRVACAERDWRKLRRAFFRLFPDQLTLFWADLGEAVIEERPAEWLTKSGDAFRAPNSVTGGQGFQPGHPADPDEVAI